MVVVSYRRLKHLDTFDYIVDEILCTHLAYQININIPSTCGNGQLVVAAVMQSYPSAVLHGVGLGPWVVASDD